MQKRESDQTNTQSSKMRDGVSKRWPQNAQSLRRLLRQLWNIVLLSLGCSLGALSLGSAALGGFLLRQVKRQPAMKSRDTHPFASSCQNSTGSDKGEAQ